MFRDLNWSFLLLSSNLQLRHSNSIGSTRKLRQTISQRLCRHRIGSVRRHPAFIASGNPARIGRNQNPANLCQQLSTKEASMHSSNRRTHKVEFYKRAVRFLQKLYYVVKLVQKDSFFSYYRF